ncbi:MAG: CTP synthetase [Thalassovita sp.]|nr:CTP synthetase [Thalassovita sp.]
MFRLGFILHIFIGSILSGTAVFVALAAGYSSTGAVIVAAMTGYFTAVPVTYLVSKALSND